MERLVASFVCGPFVTDNIEYCRHREKFEDEFFYEQFDPVRDYNLHFLFHTFLVRANVMLDETISAVTDTPWHPHERYGTT